MRPICTILFAGIMILGGLSFNISGNKAVKKETVAEPGFAVVKFFTWEDCSGCPHVDVEIK